MARTGLIKNNPIWIETYTGMRVNPLELKTTDISLNDICHSLSLMCRFVGHCTRFYSVGQHSIHVADLVHGELLPMVGGKTSPLAISIDDMHKTCLAALLHDAAEAYISDISRPVKYAVKGFREIENKTLGTIMQHFHCIGVDWQLIKRMDSVMLATEAREIMFSKGDGWDLPTPLEHDIPRLDSNEVEKLFVERFFKFGGK